MCLPNMSEDPLAQMQRWNKDPSFLALSGPHKQKRAFFVFSCTPPGLYLCHINRDASFKFSALNIYNYYDRWYRHSVTTTTPQLPCAFYSSVCYSLLRRNSLYYNSSNKTRKMIWYLFQDKQSFLNTRGYCNTKILSIS